MKERFQFARIGVLGAIFLPAATLSAAEPAVPIEVRVTRPTHGDIFRYVSLPGSLRANQQATLYAKVPGYLKSIAVDTGDPAKAGQTLAEIEVPELLADRAKLQAEVKVADADFQRINAAATKAPDLVTPQSVDNARGKREIAQASLDRAETLLGYGKLTAPFSGVVTKRYVDPGAFIPSATSGSAAQTAAVVTVMDFSTVRVQVDVPELEASLVRIGQPVKVSVDGLPGREFNGRVNRQAFALDAATRTMLVEADLPNPGLELRPGMYAAVRIGIEQHTNAVLVPAGAVATENTGASVFLAEGGHARKTAVRTGFNDGAQVEVVGGLKGDETIIVPGKIALTDGSAIQTTDAK